MPKFIPMKGGYVYIMTNRTDTTFYIGVTSDLRRRVLQHKKGVYPGSFTDRYNCRKLIWFEHYRSIVEAIAMEKRIKRWRKAWKWEAIDRLNPLHSDLSDGWYDPKDLE